MPHSFSLATRAIAALLLLAVVADAAQVQTVGVRQQCGGLLIAGDRPASAAIDAPYNDVVCEAGLKCQRASKWYWECEPAQAGSGWKLEELLHSGASEASRPGLSHRAFGKDVHTAGSDVAAFLRKVPEAVKQSDAVSTVMQLFHHSDHPQQHLEDKEDQQEEDLAPQRRLSNWQGLFNGPATNPASSDSSARLYEALGIEKDMVGQWQQCGGKNNAPDKDNAKDKQWHKAKCWPGWTCERVNEWYWQCSPNSDKGQEDGSNAPAFVEISGVKKEILDVWAQCGGKGGQIPKGESPVDGPYPKYTCFADTCCTRQNEWYWQCLPLKGGCDNVGPQPSPEPNNPQPPSPEPSPVPEPSPSPYFAPSPSPYFVPSPPVYASPSPYPAAASPYLSPPQPSYSPPGPYSIPAVYSSPSPSPYY